jgi:hypothetical protein
MRRWLFVLFISFLSVLLLGKNHEFVALSQPQAISDWLSVPYYGQVQCTQDYHSGHSGYDLNLRYERVLAAAKGTIESIGWYNISCFQGGSCAYGLYMTIRHPNNYKTLYGHLSSAVGKVGDTVKQGQVIGTSGNSGNSSGPHLHFEVYNSSNVCIDYGPDLWNNPDNCGVSPYPGLLEAKRKISEPIEYDRYLVDDGDADFLKWCVVAGCVWNSASGLGINNDMLWVNTFTTLKNAAAWSWNFSKPGIYEIWVHTPRNYGTTQQAPYFIYSTSAIDSPAHIDQRELYDQWVSIGTYSFTPNGNRYMVIKNNTYDLVTRQLGVDAIQFVELSNGKNFLPSIFR